MRLTEEKWNEVYEHWNTTFAPVDESESHFLRRLINEAEGTFSVTDAKPDRRAEVLELAGRLAVASEMGRIESLGHPMPPGMAISEDGLQEGRKYHAKDTALMALAIINAVDEAVKP